MTTVPGTSARPVRWLWWATALLALAGVLLTGAGLVGLAGKTAPDLVGLVDGASVTVDEGGFSIWSRSASTRSSATCTAGDHQLATPTQDATVVAGGSTFHEVARTPADLPPGTYVLTCSTAERLYLGPAAPSTVAPGIVGRTGLNAGLVLLGAAALGLVAGLLGRRRPQVERGSDPAAYQLQPRPPVVPGTPSSPAWGQHTATPQTYGVPPYPMGGQPSAGSAATNPAPGSGSPAGGVPYPSGGPFSRPAGGHAGAFPPAPVATGHETSGSPIPPAPGSPAGTPAPPQGPRYELPPPS